MYTKISLPENVSRIINTLNNAGYEAYAVGGCVRDTLLGRTPGDWDITTSAKPQQVKSLFRRTIDTGIQHGTVTVMFGKEGYEVTTYRIDGIYEDGRHPKEVTFTNKLVEDLKRRDFTINAMAYCDSAGIVDEFDGLRDLEKGIIRAVGNAKERFTEDALRILRALRFAAQLNYEIESDTIDAIKELKDNLKMISAERIRVEITKLLMSDHPEKLKDVYEYGVSCVVLPQFDAYSEREREAVITSLALSAKSYSKESDNGLNSEKSEEYLRFAILLKAAGANASRKILRDLKFDNETIRCVTMLVENADRCVELTPSEVRRSIVRVGCDLISILIRLWRVALREDDIKELKYEVDGRDNTIGIINEKYIDRYEEQYKQILSRGDCIALKDLAVCGRDLIDEIGMKPGRELGDVLNLLFEKVLDDPEINKKEVLMDIAGSYIMKQSL